jgi:hypothetical protein
MPPKFCDLKLNEKVSDKFIQLKGIQLFCDAFEG